MKFDPAKVEAIFSEALALPTPADRAAYLDQACHDDPDLRHRVESLLAAHDATGTFLPDAPTAPLPTPLEQPGTLIGPYKLLQQIGEGGFGVVFMAEQQKPLVRKVALKIIKLGMDTRQVIARFEAERQALAMMDHPNIARVFDAGATGAGRPYFVMEYVKGQPITEYADANHLTIPERLELFEQVCLAVQHAHHKGIIHRDLKPTNVLVSTQDGKPFAKVIDFGIAKAVAQRLTDLTLYTRHEQFIGTPQYMSPEQAAGSVDIDTRTDVYSLGVLLYELLTGSTPFAAADLRAAALDKIKQIIRDIDPPKPSTRLSASEKTLPTLAASRRTEPKKLGPLVRGELDWIVMKALEKDRARRYDTPTSFGDDVRSYLADRAIIAAPPSAVYRARKFLRRYRKVVAAMSATITVLIAGIAASGWEAHQARLSRDREAESRLLAEANAKKLNRELILNCMHEGISALKLRNHPLAALWFVRALKLDDGYDPHRARCQSIRLHLALQGCYQLVDIPVSSAPPSAVTEKRRENLLRYSDEDDLQYTSAVKSKWFDSDNQMTTICDDGTVRIWANGPSACAIRSDGSWRNFAVLSPDEKSILLANPGLVTSGLQVWDTQTGYPVTPPFALDYTHWTGAFSADGKNVVTCVSSMMDEFIVWDLRTGEPVGKPIKNDYAIYHTCFNCDGTSIIGKDSNGDLHAWDIKTGSPLSSILPPIPENVKDLSVSLDGRRVLVGYQIHDKMTGKILTPAMGNAGQAEFSPNGDYVVNNSGSDFDLYDSENGYLLGAFWGHPCFNTNCTSILTTYGELWSLKPNDLPIEAAQSLAELLSSQRIDDDGAVVVLTARDWQQRWEMLRGKYPHLFRPKNNMDRTKAVPPSYQRSVEALVSAARSPETRRELALRFSTGSIREDYYTAAGEFLAEQAVKLDESLLAAHDALALAYLRQARYTDALAICERFRGKHWNQTSSLASTQVNGIVFGERSLVYARVLREQGNTDTALEKIEAIIAPTTKPTNNLSN